MSKKYLKKPGEVLMFSHGSYSDYRVDAIVTVLKQFDLKKQAEEYREMAPGFYGERMEDAEDYEIDAHASGFVAFLARRGLVREIDKTEVYCGDGYGSFKSEFIAGLNKGEDK